jgi:hypothetical protein
MEHIDICGVAVSCAQMQIEPLTQKEYRRRRYLERVRKRGPVVLILTDVLMALCAFAFEQRFPGNNPGTPHLSKSLEWISAMITGCVWGIWQWSSQGKELQRLKNRDWRIIQRENNF